MSVAKSERECTASAIMAPLRPRIPAANLNASQKEIGQRPDERDFDYFLFAFMTLLPLHRICCVFVV